MNRTSASARGRMMAAVALAAAALGGCTGAGAAVPATVTSYGSEIAIGRGTARSYITSVGGEPTEIGVVLTEGALDGLPGPHGPGAAHMPDGHTTFEHVLRLPEGNATPFRHVLVNWNPGGHEPPGIYDKPHFDFHFYVISDADRRAIDPSDPEYQRKAERRPAAELIPRNYIMPAPLAFARMGVHWVDTTSVELKGKPFAATFIYGSWDGKLIFAEPMITKEFLASKPQFSAPLPAPRAGRAAGYYPQGYRVRWDEAKREYHITLTGLASRG
ncbi:MAG TPA: DUF5602 domain-containing protein [Gemmatimonadaceae bacterium]|nr:DUF5602 domain-containing protein [Gemmatimonadaceae bacterium]